MSIPIGIDPDGLARLNRLGGPAFVEKMISVFLEEAPERLAQAHRAEQAGDLGAVAEAAHSLKSSAQNFGASRVGDLAERLELQARAGAAAELGSLLRELAVAYDIAKAWLEHERDALPL